YDGYWRLYAAYSRPCPDNPVFLDVLWYLGYVVGLAAAIGYGTAIVWHIRRLYRLTLWQGIFALVMGLITEIVVYGTMCGIWIMLLMIIGSRLS
ncbi:MAG: hypothetical protein HY866_21325, partial [Chloroflexi bacterium]|nr:hypothetical protein [Chloroflexota bacterium]